MPSCPKCGAEYPEAGSECPECVASSKKPIPPTKTDALAVIIGAVRSYWPLMLAGVVFVFMQWELFYTWWRSWTKPYSYYSHGPLVPLIALFMVWANRKRLAMVKIQPSWFGLLLIVPAIPIYIFGRWTGSGVLCGATFMAFLIGGVLMFTGTRMTRMLLFPMLFLIAMIPAPATVLDNATFKVQLQSTTIAARLLDFTGYSVSQSGAEIHSADLPEPLIVGTPCSGFRLLISLLTFTAFFVYMIQAPAWKKAVLIALAFPLSLFINALRIAMIGYAGFWTGSTDAMHKFHDWSGYIGLVICFVILFGFAKLIRANNFGIPDVESDTTAAASTPPARGLVGGNRRGAVAIVLFVLIALSNLMIPPLEASAKGELARGNFPASFRGWTSVDVPLEEMVKTELKTADMLQRIYTSYALDGRQVVVFIEAARDTDAFHDPHSCLPGGGSPITQDETVTLKFTKPRPMKVHATMLQSSGQYGASIVLYWYMSGSTTCSSTSEVRKKMRLVQLQDLYTMAAHPGDRHKISNRIQSRQWYWYRFSTDVWQDTETDLELLKQFVREFVAESKGFGE